MPAIAGVPSFLVLLALAAMLQLMVGVSRYFYTFSLSTFAARCEVFVASVVHRFVLSLSYPSVSQYRVGDLSHLASVAPVAINNYIQAQGEVLINGFLVAAYVTALIALSYKLSVFLVVLVVSMSLLLRAVRPRVRAAHKQLAALHLRISADITEDIRSLRLLHSSATLPVAQARLEHRLNDVSQSMHRLNRVQPLLEPMMDVLPVVVGLLVGGLSWWLMGGGSGVLFPNLIVVVLLLQRTNIRLTRLTNQLTRLDGNAGNIRELDHLLNPSTKEFRRLGGLPFQRLCSEIRFEGVGFRYQGRDDDVLHDISFDLPKGSCVAIVGESGSGKSTLADLLTGLYEPSRGRILVDGQDLAQTDLNDWQHQLGIVSQDVIMLSGTIRDNVCFGLPPVADSQLRTACAAAGAAGFIDDLPDGVDHAIGESGFRLSGGQRQRLALARAFLRDPSLLVLDEATSALDSRSELHVLQALARGQTGRTVLTIAHRLSSVRDADLILVMAAGRIVERGRHHQLLALGGVYAELWHKQTSTSATPQPVDA
ncbi:MAG: ABC transporter ATP-binding protein [Cyanobacteriota bacterium]|nr:ABC transporter ATP-binding protein [Cyanobacteriota bacterium]